jgi:hypothetical protein
LCVRDAGTTVVTVEVFLEIVAMTSDRVGLKWGQNCVGKVTGTKKGGMFVFVYY